MVDLKPIVTEKFDSTFPSKSIVLALYWIFRTFKAIIQKSQQM